MKRGRVSLFTVIVAAALIGVISIVALGRGGDSAEAGLFEFMGGLSGQTKNPKVLAERTYLPGKSDAELLKAWEETCRVTKYFVFEWTYKGSTVQTEKTAVAKVNMFGRGAVDQDFNVPLIKDKDKWKVNLSVLDRKFYPSLPR